MTAKSILLFLVIVFVIVLVGGFFLMLLWNALIPAIIGWSIISYGQSVGLVLLIWLVGLIFGTNINNNKKE